MTCIRHSSGSKGVTCTCPRFNVGDKVSDKFRIWSKGEVVEKIIRISTGGDEPEETLYRVKWESSERTDLAFPAVRLELEAPRTKVITMAVTVPADVDNIEARRRIALAMEQSGLTGSYRLPGIN